MSRKPASAWLSGGWLLKSRRDISLRADGDLVPAWRRRLGRSACVPGLVLIAVAVVLSLAVPAANASIPRADNLAEESGADYHQLDMVLSYRAYWDHDVPNCTGLFGIGSGHCGENVVYQTTSTPRFGDRPWSLSWAPCSGQCPAGAIFIQIYAGASVIEGWIPDRSKGELTVISAHVPTWNPLSPITGGNDASKAKGTPGGPLYLYVRPTRNDLVYSMRVSGYLRYKRVARSFHVSGYLDYAKRDKPGTSHPFDAYLDALDTPSSPQCFNGNFVGIGGCYGSFSQGSDSPFVGAGGSAGIHWRPDSDPTGRTLVTLIAPSGSRLGGYLDGSQDRLRITSGFVPEFGATTEITSGANASATGEPGGPLRLTTTQCCALYRPHPPAPTLTRATVIKSGHEATFSFGAVDGGRKVSFWCQLDRQRFRLCRSDARYTDLAAGRHRLRVLAVYEGASAHAPTTRWFTIGSAAHAGPATTSGKA